jgi:hypothetical protein
MDREVQHEPQVLEGEDEIPHQPADLDDYTPADADSAGLSRVGLWVALAVFLAVLAIVIWAIAT